MGGVDGLVQDCCRFANTFCAAAVCRRNSYKDELTCIFLNSHNEPEAFLRDAVKVSLLLKENTIHKPHMNKTGSNSHI